MKIELILEIKDDTALTDKAIALDFIEAMKAIDEETNPLFKKLDITVVGMKEL